MTPSSPALAPSSPVTTANGEVGVELIDQLASFLKSMPRDPLTIRLVSADGTEQSASVPVHVARLFHNVLEQLARGRGAKVIPIDLELTTEEAAEFLHVSRPCLVDLLDRGVIPHREVGANRRVRLEELSKFQRLNDEKRYEALAEMVALDQEFGFY